MNQRNRSAGFPPSATARGVVQVTSHIAALLDLQLDLLRIDAREVARLLIVPAILVVAAMTFALAGFVALVLCFAAALVQIANLSVAMALLVAALAAILIAASAMIGAVRMLRRSRVPFGRSLQEARSNLAWVRRMNSRESDLPPAW